MGEKERTTEDALLDGVDRIKAVLLGLDSAIKAMETMRVVLTNAVDDVYEGVGGLLQLRDGQ